MPDFVFSDWGVGGVEGVWDHPPPALGEERRGRVIQNVRSSLLY